ncbi:MAG: FAD:protein FMN transferase [Chitinophagaceae bacterium]|nr:MAG: FAD:protein FMN transferase [Chitinophagaceae bacterium]
MLRWIFVFLLPLTLSAQLRRYQFTEKKMGSPFNIIFYHTDSVEAVQFAHECFLIVDSLNNVFSDYSATSEVGLLVQQTNNPDHIVSNELFEMILHSKEAWKKSGKTFDITIGPLSQLWRKARSEKRFPSAAEIKKAKLATGFENLVINNNTKTISFKKPGMRLDFGGIVKGYAAQKVVDYLKSKKIVIALADAGGDIVMSDAPPGKEGWSIGINLPEQENELWDKKLELKNCSVATSGDVYQFTLHNGKKYSHIIDPLTGYGVTSQRNVTVIAKDGATADWLATACSILSIEKAMVLARKENAALLIATLKDDKIIIHKTGNFDSYFQHN